MKPILIKIPIDSSEKIKLSFQELEEIVQQTYDQGYRDGQNSTGFSIGYPSSVPPTTRYTEITCDTEQIERKRGF